MDQICDNCRNEISYGGVRDGIYVYCNEDCHLEGQLEEYAMQLPDDIVLDAVKAVYEGSCPTCLGAGQVDIRTSYRIWSSVFVSRWYECHELCCPECGRRNKRRDLLFSSLLGWWGLPFGVFVTPVQIWRNVRGLKNEGASARPSPALERHTRHELAKTAIRAGKNRISRGLVCDEAS